MTDTVLFTRENQVAIITFNRPEQLNALSREMTGRLEEVVRKVKDDPFIRAILLRGAGQAFMAGSDLNEVSEALDTAATDSLYLSRQFNAAIAGLRETNKPVLAAVQGIVAGTGMSLMIAADLVIASDTTRFSLGFCNMATSPVGAVSYNLPRLVGTKKAMELLLLSDFFDANRAANLGLVNWICPEEELTTQTQTIIERLVNGPTLAFAHTKQLINSSWQNKMSAQLELEVESFVKSVNTRDFKAAVNAYVNKRQPEFEGR